jgi:hypothetical protein
MRAKTVNESQNQDSLIKRKEALLKQKIKADQDWEKAWEKKEKWIEKYGERAWDLNMGFYPDGYNAWKYSSMRYPGKAAWRGEGPIEKKLNDISNRQSSIEQELEEVEELLAGGPKYESRYTEDDFDEDFLRRYSDMPDDEIIERFYGLYDKYTSDYKAGYLYGDADSRISADKRMDRIKMMERYLEFRLGSKVAIPIIVKAESLSDDILND